MVNAAVVVVVVVVIAVVVVNLEPRRLSRCWSIFLCFCGLPLFVSVRFSPPRWPSG